MNHSQHTELMNELRAIRSVLERSADLADRLAAPVETTTEQFKRAAGLGRAAEESDAEALAQSFDVMAPTFPAIPVAEIKPITPAEFAFLKSVTGADHPDPIKPAAPGAQRKRGERRGK